MGLPGIVPVCQAQTLVLTWRWEGMCRPSDSPYLRVRCCVAGRGSARKLATPSQITPTGLIYSSSVKDLGDLLTDDEAAEREAAAQVGWVLGCPAGAGWMAGGGQHGVQKAALRGRAKGGQLESTDACGADQYPSSNGVHNYVQGGVPGYCGDRYFKAFAGGERVCDKFERQGR